MNNECPLAGACKSSEDLICSPVCPLYLDIRYQIELSSIPKRNQKYTALTLPSTYFALDIFHRFASNIVERVESGQGLYLFSTLTGTGKSTTACALAISYIIERLKLDIAKGIRTPQLVKFVNVPDFLELLRRGMNDFDTAITAMKVTEQLKRVPLLILDDFGAEKISEWSRERLLTIISERYDNEKATFITSNIGLQEVQVLLGGRIRSRIEGMTVPIEFKGKDWRRKI